VGVKVIQAPPSLQYCLNFFEIKNPILVIKRISCAVIFSLFSYLQCISGNVNASPKFGFQAGPGGGKIVGKVVEAPDDTPVSFATVAVLQSLDSTIVDGITADENGTFAFDNVKSGKYMLRISNMGYDTRFVGNVNISPESNITDLGLITVLAVSQKLNEVIVRGEKSMIEDDIDKKMIHIGKDLLATSNNVSDLLQKLPAVSLDENGNPQVRGKGNVVVLIDGKPSTLYGNDLPTILQSFPAELIDRIDVMTTPSAKYEGDGTSGVIDIITKKVKIRGLNGGGRLSYGNRGNHNASGNFNYRSGKIGISAATSLQSRSSAWRRRQHRDNFLSEEISTLKQAGNGFNKGKNLFGRVGMNYDINEKNNISLGVNYSLDGNNSASSVDNQTSLASTGLLTEQFLRNVKSNGDGNNMSMNVDYRKKFNKKNHLLSFTANYSLGQSDGKSWYDQESETESLERHQQNFRHNERNSFFFNTDYTCPLAEKTTVEMGFRTRMGSSENTNAFYNVNDEDGTSEFDNNVSNIFGYENVLYSGYMTFSQKTDNWGIRGGLRLSDFDQRINQVSNNREFSVHFLTLVPSLAVTRKIDDASQVKVNYSRRVQRPEAGWLNPFTDVSDPRNIQTGNPNLRPEFVHKAEMGYSKYEQSGGWGPSLFMDYSNNAITRLRTVDAEGISLTRYDNVGREMSYGLETDFSQKLGEVVKINASGRVFRSEVYSALAQIDNRTWSYSGNLNAFFSLPMEFKASAYLNYEGPRAIAQGTREGVFVANMGIRRDLMEKKATLSFNVQDIFLSRAYKSQLATATYVQNSLWQQTNRLVNLSFHYRFGKISANGNDDV
jgi:outer membrane receptor protein involved in Fe transport